MTAFSGTPHAVNMCPLDFTIQEGPCDCEVGLCARVRRKNGHVCGGGWDDGRMGGWGERHVCVVE